MNFSTSVKVKSVLGLNTKVEAYEILHMLTKIQNFATLELRDMKFLVTLGCCPTTLTAKRYLNFRV
jgi:hypothetical protein